MHRAKTAFTVLFFGAALVGSILLFAKGCHADDSQSSTTSG